MAFKVDRRKLAILRHFDVDVGLFSGGVFRFNTVLATAKRLLNTKRNIVRNYVISKNLQLSHSDCERKTNIIFQKEQVEVKHVIHVGKGFEGDFCMRDRYKIT